MTNQQQKADETSSMGLSYLLRTSAPEFGLHLDPQGYADIDAILQLSRFKSLTVEDIKRISKNDDKQRYTIRTDPATGKLQIRANQGHTIPLVQPSMKKITLDDVEPLGEVVHGTSRDAWQVIRFEGLNRLNRNHIHFGHGPENEEGHVPGVRNDTSVHVFLDLRKAIDAGYEFFLSTNEVVLSPGGDSGSIPAKFFTKVIDRDSGEKMADFIKTDFNREDYIVQELPETLLHCTLQRHVNAVRWDGMKQTLGEHVHFQEREDWQEGKKKVEVVFHLDVELARREGKKFYQYEKGGLFLHPGVLEKRFFSKVVDVKTGRNMVI